MPGSGNEQPFGIGEPSLDDLATLHEPLHTVGAEDVEHRLGHAPRLDRAERPLLDRGQLGLEEEVGLADSLVERPREDGLQGRAVIVAAHMS
jgi:hypothetical protein